MKKAVAHELNRLIYIEARSMILVLPNFAGGGEKVMVRRQLGVRLAG